MRKDELSLLRIGVLRLLLDIIVLLLKDFLFSFELAFQVVDLSVSFGLDDFEVLLKTVTLLLDSLYLLLEASLFRHHALGAELKPLVQGILFFLKSANSRLKGIHLVAAILNFVLQFFLEFLLKGHQNCVCVVLMLRFMLVLRLLELLNSLLELQKSLIVIFLGLIFLPLEEIEFTLPKSLLFVELTLEFSMLLLHVIVLALPVLNLLSDSKLTLGKSLVKLLVLLLKLLIFNFVALDEIFLLSLQVLIFFNLNSLFSLELRMGLLDILLKLFKCLSLLLEFDFNTLLLLLDSGGSL